MFQVIRHTEKTGSQLIGEYSLFTEAELSYSLQKKGHKETKFQDLLEGYLMECHKDGETIRIVQK